MLMKDLSHKIIIEKYFMIVEVWTIKFGTYCLQYDKIIAMMNTILHKTFNQASRIFIESNSFLDSLDVVPRPSTDWCFPSSVVWDKNKTRGKKNQPYKKWGQK